MVLKLFFILFFVPFSYASMGAVGEKNFRDYHGPTNPNYVYDHYKNELDFIDEWIQEKSITQGISFEVNQLETFFTKEFLVGAYCPQSIYDKHSGYIQYLYRIQTLSYLFQSLREHEYISKKFNLKTKCEVDWISQFKRCEPQSREMKLFVADSKIALKELKSVIVPREESKKKYFKLWREKLTQKKPESLTLSRLIEDCPSCNFSDRDQITKMLSNACEEEKNLFAKICSEGDRLYGASSVPEIYHLIVSSSGVNGINKEGYASGCLKRFTEYKKSSEINYAFLKKMFSILYEHNLHQSPAYPQGRLFSIGSVKEFTDKGLTRLFKPAKKKKKKLIKNESVPLISLENPEFEKIELPKIVVKKYKKTKENKKKRKQVKKKGPKRSSFFITSEFREKYKLDKVEVDLARFYYDYVFSLSTINKLNPKIKKFSKVSSLKSMKKHDQLGSKKAPIPLRFIKFLIERKDHQSLFNIIQVVGDHFFIFNDIDEGIRKLDKVVIKNDHSTKFNWKLYIVSP